MNFMASWVGVTIFVSPELRQAQALTKESWVTFFTGRVGLVIIFWRVSWWYGSGRVVYSDVTLSKKLGFVDHFCSLFFPISLSLISPITFYFLYLCMHVYCFLSISLCSFLLFPSPYVYIFLFPLVGFSTICVCAYSLCIFFSFFASLPFLLLSIFYIIVGVLMCVYIYIFPPFVMMCVLL